MKIIFLILSLLPVFTFAGSSINIVYQDVVIGDSTKEALSKLPDDYFANRRDDNPHCFFILRDNYNNGIDFMVVNGHVALIYFDENDVNGPIVNGLGIGSAKNQILKTFPKVTSKPHHSGNGEYLSIELGNGNGVLFHILEDDIVFEIRFGRMPELYLREGCS